jgi:F-type H+-transporting ATPase subunit b
VRKYFCTLAAWALPAAARAAAAGEVDVVPDNFGLQVWVILTFLVMLALLAKLAFKPIAEALDRRSQTIRQSIEEAERQRAEAKKLLEDYQKQLAAARAEAGKIIEEARALGENVRKEALEKANAEASALIQRAREEIQRQKEKGIEELKDTVASLSVQVAARVIEKELNEAAHRQLVENLIQELARMRKA